MFEFAMQNLSVPLLVPMMTLYNLLGQCTVKFVSEPWEHKQMEGKKKKKKILKVDKQLQILILFCVNFKTGFLQYGESRADKIVILPALSVRGIKTIFDIQWVHWPAGSSLDVVAWCGRSGRSPEPWALLSSWCYGTAAWTNTSLCDRGSNSSLYKPLCLAEGRKEREKNGTELIDWSIPVK